MQIYVVCGSTGEYSDRSEWLTKAFKTEQEAQAFVEQLQTAYLSLPSRGYGYQRHNTQELNAAMLPLDPQFNEDYTGTSWYVQSTELEG